MTRRVCAVVTAVALAATLAPIARAQQADLERARTLYLDADFPGARAVLQSVLRSPTLDRRSGAEAHRYLATLALVLEDPTGAERHALAAVALEHDVSPPPGAPAEAPALFDRARATLGARRLALTITHTRNGATTLRLAPVVAGLVARLVLRCHQGDRVREASGDPPNVALAIDDASVPLRCTGAAFTEGGAGLLRTRSVTAPVPVHHERGASAWPWIGVGAGVLATAGVIAALLIAGASDGPPHFDSTVVDGWR